MAQSSPGLPSSLSSTEAARILAQVGPNELPAAARGRLARIILETLREPMLVLLFICSGVYLTMGDREEAILLLISALFVALISIFQEFRAERAIQSLKSLSSPRASVVRDGAETKIAGSEIVPGDLLVLREGDRIAADGQLVSAENLQVDESLVTGESLPVRKSNSALVLSGTLVVAGHALARVTATGPRCELGKIGQFLSQTDDGQRTEFQKQTGRVIRTLSSVSVVFCFLIFVVYGLRLGNWIEAALAGLSTAMSILPEELPIVVTLFLVLGARRISQHSVLARKMPAIENLGAINVLCVDKTGTLTQNRMELRTLWTESERDQSLAAPAELSENAREVLRTCVCANHATAYDPMERAIEKAWQSFGREPLQAGTRRKEWGLSAALPIAASAWEFPGKTGYRLTAKGAPEAVFGLCGLEKSRQTLISAEALRLAESGYRVLAVADAQLDAGSLPESIREVPLRFLGLVGFNDPVRPEVPASLISCYEAGIRVVMMTGDHPGTALAVARQIGMDLGGGAITGTELQLLTDTELQERARNTNIFARLRPEHKFRLVQALQDNGDLVAMTGDGVNDAPSLKAADIGIAMGKRGTDVAREAADLVLLDDNFSSIVNAIRLGRRIFKNVRNAVSYILSIHIPIAWMAILPVLLKRPLILLPAQIVFLEFIIDPACSFVFEAETDGSDLMKTPPRPRGVPLFRRRDFAWGLTQGLIALAVVSAVYTFGANHGFMPDTDPNHARSLAFTTLVFSNLALIFVNRSGTASVRTLLKRGNRVFLTVLALALGSLLLLLAVPYLKHTFAFGHLDGLDLLYSAGAGLITVALAQSAKMGFRRAFPDENSFHRV